MIGHAHRHAVEAQMEWLPGRIRIGCGGMCCGRFDPYFAGSCECSRLAWTNAIHRPSPFPPHAAGPTQRHSAQAESGEPSGPRWRAISRVTDSASSVHARRPYRCRRWRGWHSDQESETSPAGPRHSGRDRGTPVPVHSSRRSTPPRRSWLAPSQRPAGPTWNHHWPTSAEPIATGCRFQPLPSQRPAVQRRAAGLGSIRPPSRDHAARP